jgi:hypothetical protein
MKAILTSLIFGLTASMSMAQVGSYAGAAFRVGHSPYGRAMGNAFTASAGAEGAYHNPANAAISDRKSAEFARSLMAFDRSISSAAFHTSLPPTAGLSIGVVYAAVDGFDGRTVSGYPTGTFGIYEAQVFTAFGIRIGKRSSIGAGVKVSLADYNNQVDAATAVGIDLGFRREWTDRTIIGVSVQDLVAAYTWNTQELYGTVGANQVVNAFPTRFRVGIRHTWTNLNLAGHLEAERRVQTSTYTRERLSTELGDPRIIRTETETRNAQDHLRGAVEWSPVERFHIRGSMDSQGVWAVGFGLTLPVETYLPILDYTLLSERDGIPLTHQIALRIRL